MLQETNLKYKDRKRLKAMGWQKIHHGNLNTKSDEKNFKARTLAEINGVFYNDIWSNPPERYNSSKSVLLQQQSFQIPTDSLATNNRLTTEKKKKSSKIKENCCLKL